MGAEQEVFPKGKVCRERFLMRIFASVGTHPQPFDRLLKELDRIAAGKDMEIFAQVGNTNFKPKNYAFKKFLNEEEYQLAIKKAGLVISHGGAGTIINALRNRKPLVIVPRLKRFGEHTNDHQLDLAKALASRGKAVAVEKISDLESAIHTAFKSKAQISSEREGLIREIGIFLQGLDK